MIYSYSNISAVCTRSFRIVLSFASMSVAYMATTVIAHAQQQSNFVPLSNINTSSSQSLSGIFQANSLASFVNGLFIFAISVGGFIAVGRLVYAGWLYMVLGDSAGGASKAKVIFRDVAIGVLLLLSIWLILNVINPNILNLNILGSFSQ